LLSEYDQETKSFYLLSADTIKNSFDIALVLVVTNVVGELEGQNESMSQFFYTEGQGRSVLSLVVSCFGGLILRCCPVRTTAAVKGVDPKV